MSLWIYKNNNYSATGHYAGDWFDFFEQAEQSDTGVVTWGGPDVTNQARARALAESARPRQRFLCWQRWGKAPAYERPPGAHAAAMGIVKLVKVDKRRTTHDRWHLRVVERFDPPVPLLAYRQISPIIDGIFKSGRSMGTFDELSAIEEEEVLRILKMPRSSDSAMASQQLGASTRVTSRRSDGSGAGFGDAETNRKVERAAVRFVTEKLQGEGWKVISKEKENVGYDLLATKRGAQRHIEVKGVRDSKATFFITAGEVRAAQTDPKWEIWVVTSALTSRPSASVIPGADFGAIYKIDPVSFRASPVP